MFSKLFLIDALERAVSTAAQTTLLALGGQQLDKVSGGLMVLVYAALGGLVASILKSLAACKVGDNESASFTVGSIEH